MIVLDLGVEARQVEAIRQILLVDLAEVLVAAGRDELGRARRVRRKECSARDRKGWMDRSETYPIPPIAGVVTIGLGPVVIHLAILRSGILDAAIWVAGRGAGR